MIKKIVKLLGALVVAGAALFSCSNEITDNSQKIMQAYLLTQKQNVVEYGSITVNTASNSRALEVSSIKSVAVKVFSSDFSEITEKSSSISNGSGNVTIEKIPVGKNRIVSVTAYNSDDERICDIAAVTAINAGNNNVSVNWESSKTGFVYKALCEADVAISSLSVDDNNLIAKAIPSGTHALLINADAIAADYKAGALKSSSAYVMTAGTLNVSASNLNGYVLTVNDPVSAKAGVSVSGDGNYTVSNVAPGFWTLKAVKGSDVKSKIVKVTGGSTTDVSIGQVVVPAFNGIQIQVSKSKGAPQTQIHSTDNGFNAQWPGVDFDSTTSNDYYIYNLEGATKGTFVIHGSGYQYNVVINAAGSYICDSETPVASTFIGQGGSGGNEDEYSKPVVTITPAASSVKVNGKITVNIDDGNADITSALVKVVCGSTTKTYSYKDFADNVLQINVSDFTTDGGVSLSVTASADNAIGNGTAAASYTVPAVSVGDDFDGIQIQVLKSLGFPKIHYWACSDATAYPATSWPGIDMLADYNDDYYIFNFDNTSSVSLLITNSSKEKLCSNNITISKKGSYVITSGGAAESEYISEVKAAPTVKIEPATGATLQLKDKITITLKKNNADITSAAVTVSGGASKSYGYSSFTKNTLVIPVSDLATEGDVSFTVSVTAANAIGTGTAAATFTTPAAEKPSISITPIDGSEVGLSGNIKIKINNGNTALTSASVSVTGAGSKNYSLSSFNNGSLDIPVSDITSTAGASINVSVSATNKKGTSTASAALTTKEGGSSGSNDWNNLRIYQVMVSSFMDGDSSIGYSYAYGPSTTYDYYTGSSSNTLTGGDLQGIINAADYIAGLGVNAIWMTPIFDSSSGENNEYLNSTGYFCYDYFKIDPKFGTNEKFAELVETYHSKGIYVILDGVFGHWNGAGVKESPIGNIAVRKNGQYKACAYPDSLEFFKEVAQFWIKEYKIDGWRFDQCYQVGNGDKAVGDNSYTNDHNYWYEIRTAIAEAAAENASAGNEWGTLGYTVGEHWNGDASKIQRGSVAPGANGAGYGLQSCFDFPSRYRLVQTMAREEGTNTATDFGAAMEYTYGTFEEKGYEHPEGYYPNLFFTNHDLVRYGNLLNWKFSLDPTKDEYFTRHKLMLSVLAGYSGPITTYYGDEWGAIVKGYDGAGSLGAYNDNMARSTGKINGFTEKEADLIDYYKSLMSARDAHPALWKGEAETVSSTETTYVVKKTYGSETVYICFNNGNSATTFRASGTDLVTGANYSGTVSVPALSAVFVLAK